VSVIRLAGQIRSECSDHPARRNIEGGLKTPL
jgi:hypothetical protein